MMNCKKSRKARYLTIGAIVAAVGLTTAGVVYASDKDCSFGGSGKHGGGHQSSMMGGAHQGMMKLFDPDGTGKIDIKQAEGVLKDEFVKFDADKDGKLGIDEFQGLWAEHSRPMMVRMFQRHDADGKGYLTPDDFTDKVKRMMSYTNGLNY